LQYILDYNDPNSPIEDVLCRFSIIDVQKIEAMNEVDLKGGGS
jgi:hypothetical protein